MNRSEKSADAVVVACKGRRAEREGYLEVMSLEGAMHQKPGQPGRTDGEKGEARLDSARDEARLAGHKQESSGPAPWAC
jgi:hypothetical protein